ncbi:MAG: hypothetical protein WC655_12145, partial [Candidatus Hydrogenedentales bacterium]
MQFRGLWVSLIIVVAASFTVLIYFGNDIYRMKPPIPSEVATADGKVLFTASDIQDGQNVWQSTGGQQLGTVWGHGSYSAPDWSADWLHREAESLLNRWAKQDHAVDDYHKLTAEQLGALKARLKKELRTNTYDPVTGKITVSNIRAKAIAEVQQHYETLYSGSPELADLRDAYAIPSNVLPDPERRRKLTAFYF